MNPYEEINRHPDRRERLKFGLTLLIAFPLLGLLLWLFLGSSARTALVLLGVGVTCLLVSFHAKLGSWLYVLWMGLGITMGLVVSPIVLALAYGILFVPLGIVFKLAGRDPMKRKMAQDGSYWQACQPERGPRSYFKQF
jgi:hypothetical protein